ncbi:hypothetical protein N186_02355 [Thermofilum adornatum]|uniref:Uncharacterized protein n=1 Tax=Thermofilum adornatum TaxID=1365176 RepID=S6A5A4_9CREN|nr:hypothetical protein N186_02355 [Thermofilum adornatum]
MFNVYFYQEVCKTALALKFTRWKLLKLPYWEASQNAPFWVGNFSRKPKFKIGFLTRNFINNF